MDEKRIYGTRFEIDTDRTKELYNKRADGIKEMKSSYTSVLLGDQNPEYAEKWNIIEKDTILPFLGVNKNSSVLDLGCGIGRWAETLLPSCRKYIGVDFSEGMIGEARKRCGDIMNENSEFICSSVQHFLDTYDIHDAKNRFDVIIISYVCMYINDSEMEEVMRRISECAADSCVIYFIDTVALEDRLTLNEIYSEALRSDYSAIYRTISEYDSFYKTLQSSGFSKTGTGFMPKLNGEKEFSETDRYYTILKR